MSLAGYTLHDRKQKK